MRVWRGGVVYQYAIEGPWKFVHAWGGNEVHSVCADLQYIAGMICVSRVDVSTNWCWFRYSTYIRQSTRHYTRMKLRIM
jgi:hypothetical protein